MDKKEKINLRLVDTRILQKYLSKCFLMSMNIVNPKPFLASLVGHRVAVKLKWGQEYRGNLISTDSYINVQLDAAEEWKNNVSAGALGEVLIRCNNILYIRAAPTE